MICVAALQSSMQGLARQIEEAAAVDKYDEATALQSELDSSTAEANALAAEYAFTAEDMQDLVAAPSPPTEQALNGSPSPLATSHQEPKAQPASTDGTQHAVTDDGSVGRKTQPQDSQDLSNALSREGMMDYEDGESIDPDDDGVHVGYSSSVISASHAATDGSRSVQSSRTVLDRMPEFNMDDAVSFRWPPDLLSSPFIFSGILLLASKSCLVHLSWCKPTWPWVQ